MVSMHFTKFYCSHDECDETNIQVEFKLKSIVGKLVYSSHPLSKADHKGGFMVWIKKSGYLKLTTMDEDRRSISGTGHLLIVM